MCARDVLSFGMKCAVTKQLIQKCTLFAQNDEVVYVIIFLALFREKKG